MEKVNLDNTQIPLHYQISDYLLHMLNSGALHPDDKLPPEEELRNIFGVSRTTIRRALEHLHYKGLLIRKQGKGTFWTNEAYKFKKEKLSGINREIFNVTEKTSVKVLSKLLSKERREINKFLEQPEDSEVVIFRRLRFVENEPMSYTINYLPPKYGLAIEKKHLEEMTMLETLEKVLNIELGTIEHVVEITRADKVVSENLRIPTLDPVLTIMTSVFDASKKPVEIVWTYFVENKYKFRVVLDK